MSDVVGIATGGRSRVAFAIRSSYRWRVEVRWLLWDDYNIEHIAKHGVKPAEVEQVVFGTGMKGPFEDNRNRPGRLLFFGLSGQS